VTVRELFVGRERIVGGRGVGRAETARAGQLQRVRRRVGH
jgi:hypothetical protein